MGGKKRKIQGGKDEKKKDSTTGGTNTHSEDGRLTRKTAIGVRGPSTYENGPLKKNIQLGNPVECRKKLVRRIQFLSQTVG